MPNDNDKPKIINLTCTRGDTFMKHVGVKTTQEGQIVDYEFQEGDVLKFGVSKSYKNLPDYELVKEKSIPTDTCILALSKEETGTFEYTVYNYDIEFTRAADGYRKTLIQGTFTVTEESV